MIDQTQAVYAAEDLWQQNEPQARIRFGDWDEVWPFYWSLANRMEGIRAPTVKARKGALKAHYDRNTATVFLPPYDKGGSWALNVATAMHEFAHHVSPESGHGPEFRAAMIQCLESLGWETEPLLKAYTEAGLGATTKADSITDKVGKLLTHADKAGTDEERRTYLEKAEGLAAEHSISLAILRKKQADGQDESRDRPTTGKLFNLSALSSTTYRNLAVELGTAIGRAHGAQCTIRGKSQYMTFYGFPEDIDLTELMLSRVTPMMFEEADAYLKSPEHRSSGVAGVSARITFCKSFAWEVGHRLKEAVTTTEREVLAIAGEQAASTELALREKAVEVKDYVAHEFKRQGVRGSWKGSNTGSHSEDAYSAGKRSAQQANLFGRKEIR